MQTRKPLSLDTKKQHRHKTLQLHCLDCKQRTHEKISKNRIIKHENKLPLNQHNKNIRIAGETMLFHSLKAKHEITQ